MRSLKSDFQFDDADTIVHDDSFLPLPVVRGGHYSASSPVAQAVLFLSYELFCLFNMTARAAAQRPFSLTLPSASVREFDWRANGDPVPMMVCI